METLDLDRRAREYAARYWITPRGEAMLNERKNRAEVPSAVKSKEQQHTLRRIYPTG